MKTIADVIACPLDAGCATMGATDTTDQAKQEILAATDAWRAAFDSRDPARITAMYDKEAVFWGTTMKSVATTPTVIADYFKGAPGRPDTRVVFTEQHVRVFGDVAFNSGAYTFKDKVNGNETTRPARFSMVFQRQGGAWMLVHHHSSWQP